jgi:hypothetical protein
MRNAPTNGMNRSNLLAVKAGGQHNDGNVCGRLREKPTTSYETVTQEMMRNSILWTLPVAMLTAVSMTQAADFNMDVKLDGVTLGKSVSGGEIDVKGLKGRVVLLEFWGIR